MKVQPIFRGKPQNYAKIDNVLSRSAQPMKEDFIWLKEQGVTDVINFRTMYESGLGFDEKEVVTSLGMKYHQIPSVTFKPNENNIQKFFNVVSNVITEKGRAHIHCKAGSDRTGMYAFIYKCINNLGKVEENEREWLNRGHNTQLYPNLINWTKEFVRKYKKTTV